jgi:chromosome segregation ATPase
LGDGETEPARDVSDAEARLRRELAKLTPEALIDEVVGLKAQLAEEREKRRRVEAERDELRDQITVLTAEGDLGRKLGAALDAERRTRGRLRQVQAQLARETRRSNSLERRVQDLEGRLAGQEITL